MILESQLIANDRTLSQKQEELQNTNAHIEELQKMLDNGDEQEFIEKAARERLGYVYPDEQVFIDPTAN
ncbi:MAG: septum formation initiator family protein [Oscillospiraceae bacterium]|nr:septum formation initiator family protein [Candidatus Equicaccousia limihippi]